MIASRGTAYPRIAVTAIVLGTGLAILGARLVWLGTVAAQGKDLSSPEQSIPAPRGTLWDRRGMVLATENYAYDVAAVPRNVPDQTAFAQQVGPLLSLDPAKVLATMQQYGPHWAILAHGLTKAQADALTELEIAGLEVAKQPQRAYPLGPAAAHITGFWNPFDVKAYYGIESRYDRELRGRPGAITGNMGTDPRSFRPARRGNDLVLTLDRDIQLAATKALETVMREEAAAGATVIVLEPATGAILANVSLPSYDPNRYAESDPAHFSDPATAMVYEPGSVIKAYTMAAAIDAGLTSPGATYEDEGSIDVDGAPIYNWDHIPHGTTSMTDLLSKSLNVGAVHLGLGLGPDRFYRYLTDFGFGNPTGVDLEGEVAGLMHIPGDGSQWSEGVLARNSFGQAMASTPMQVAAAMGAIANDGMLMVPHFVGARVLADGTHEPVRPQQVRQVVRPETARTVRKMLHDVVTGHVTQAAVPGYSVGGKTGTSQIPIAGGYDEDKTIASFCGFLPVDAPRVVILVKVDRPTAPLGSEVAAPVFRQVAEAVISALDIPQDQPVESWEKVDP